MRPHLGALRATHARGRARLRSARLHGLPHAPDRPRSRDPRCLPCAPGRGGPARRDDRRAARAGWEPSLCVVSDGIVPIDPLLRAVGALVAERVPTRIDVRAEFLAGVEDAFESMAADLMIAVRHLRATTRCPRSISHRFRPRWSRAPDHPLARGRHDERALRGHLLLTVRGSDPRLDFPTAGLEARSTVHLNDFAAKRTAILAGIGYGWLPDVLIAGELAREKLRRIPVARRPTCSSRGSTTAARSAPQRAGSSTRSRLSRTGDDHRQRPSSRATTARDGHLASAHRDRPPDRRRPEIRPAHPRRSSRDHRRRARIARRRRRGPRALRALARRTRRGHRRSPCGCTPTRRAGTSARSASTSRSPTTARPSASSARSGSRLRSPTEQRTRLAEIAEKTPVTKTIKRGTIIATSLA